MRVGIIMDFDFKWEAYHPKIHERNWSIITDILKACNIVLRGGEIWAGSFLCWKDNVQQAHINTAEHYKKFIKARFLESREAIE